MRCIGCFVEVSIQLLIIMTGKQILGSGIKFIRPLIAQYWHRVRNLELGLDMDKTRWHNDNALASVVSVPLFGCCDVFEVELLHSQMNTSKCGFSTDSLHSLRPLFPWYRCSL